MYDADVTADLITLDVPGLDTPITCILQKCKVPAGEWIADLHAQLTVDSTRRLFMHQGYVEALFSCLITPPGGTLADGFGQLLVPLNDFMDSTQHKDQISQALPAIAARFGAVSCCYIAEMWVASEEDVEKTSERIIKDVLGAQEVVLVIWERYVNHAPVTTPWTLSITRDANGNAEIGEPKHLADATLVGRFSRFLPPTSTEHQN